jgi:hypothetical protein
MHLLREADEIGRYAIGLEPVDRQFFLALRKITLAKCAVIEARWEFKPNGRQVDL